MPGFATHYLFGVDACRHLASARLQHNIKKYHCAYALGLQGPDLFFYYLPSYLMHKENLGALAHSTRTGEFFSNLLDSRRLFAGKKRELAIADIYILGFLGHYTLDCTLHPYVYAFTGYSPKNPPRQTQYFGRHAYFETEIDNLLLWQKKHMRPSEFHPYATIRLSPREHRVIMRMLVYAYRTTYPGVLATEILLGSAPQWMMLCMRLFNDPSGQKKVLVRLFERIAFGRAFLSPLLPSDKLRFIVDPLNHRRKTWRHPWSGQASNATFDELYASAGRRYMARIRAYCTLVRAGFPDDLRARFLKEYGSLSFQSGLPCES
ncbi:MAG: zinc dependent phospholipase C family protein [Muribaculaceae bacterium]|nr:zinc dependent phospholipase C family protein [Roseburia sp.]MCM1430060.1 zinc dependent phospholipase C family protein [Muribaculaceae bacterium]MCM1493867.1 zinc dependent phospholipase C family protein [Muribaculaceae bacterium]